MSYLVRDPRSSPIPWLPISELITMADTKTAQFQASILYSLA